MARLPRATSTQWSRGRGLGCSSGAGRDCRTDAARSAVPGLAGGVRKGADARANPQPPARGAVHSAEIEYALGNLASNKVYAWMPEDEKVSRFMQAYFANFVRAGDPNGPDLPNWPPANRGDDVQFMRIDVDSRVEPDRHRGRYELLDALRRKKD